MKTTWATRVVLGLTLVACSNGEDRLQKTKARIDAQAQADQARKAAVEVKPVPEAKVVLESFWEEAAYSVFPGGKCPEGFWALFSGAAPGSTAAEKKQNLAKRAELAAGLKGKKILVKLRAPEGVRLKPYDAPQGVSPLEVVGSLECSDEMGLLTLAWTPAKAEPQRASSLQEGVDIMPNLWNAEPLAFPIPQSSMEEGKKFEQKNKFGLAARVVVEVLGTSVDKKVKYIGKTQLGDIKIGGGHEDWGAGRLVKAKLLGVRIGTDREKTSLVDKRY